MSISNLSSKTRPWLLRRGPAEGVATVLICVGILMMVQPFFLWLYSHSFITILAGTVGFMVVSHFPDK